MINVIALIVRIVIVKSVIAVQILTPYEETVMIRRLTKSLIILLLIVR